MDKARLQELCQKRRWGLPEYTHSGVGMGHETRFVASVTVNGSVFESPDAESRSVKEAQNKAAAVAFEILSAAPATNAVPLLPPSLAVESISARSSQTALLVDTTYKVRLQELCQKRRWDLPQYTHSKVESFREPRFVASVTVNGSVFESPDAESRSIKEAQNKAAAVALETLSIAPATIVVPSPPPPPPPAVESISAQPSQIAVEAHATYKSQLQVYAQKRNKELPTYTTVSVGLPHAPQFKATVVIDGLTFECPQFFKTIREAEHAAAEVALANFRQEESSEQNSKDEVGFSCKTQLQEYMQKRKQPLPVYTTIKDPDSSLPLFLSMVEVCGRTFKGGVARTKKQAETSAAKVALDHIEGRKQSQVSSSSSTNLPMNGTQNSCSSTMKSKLTVQPVSLSLPISIPTSDQVMPENQSGHQKSAAQESKIEVAQESMLPNNLMSAAHELRIEAAQESKLPNNLSSAARELRIEAAQESKLSNNPASAVQEPRVEAAQEFKLTSAAQEPRIQAVQESKLTKNQMLVTQEPKPLPVSPISEPVLTTKDCKLDPAAPSNLLSTINSIYSEGPVLAATKDSDNEGIEPFLMSNQIQVYPSCPGSAAPNGVIPLPFSDDTWIAVSFDNIK